MRYIKLGLSPLKSANIALGADGFGTWVPERAAHKIMAEYIERGGNHIDTARIYGFAQKDEQLSERCIGRFLKEHGGREKIIIATKGAHPRFDTMHTPRLSFEEIEKDLDESLLALGVDYIDIYYLHRDNEAVSAGEIIESLNALIKKGKIREIGASNWRGERIAAAREHARRRKISPFSVSQIKYSLAKTLPGAISDDTLVEMDEKEYSFYEGTKMPICAFSPQAKGFFAKLAAAGEDSAALSEKAALRYMSDENREKYAAALEMAKSLGVSISAVILGYIMAAPFPVIPIIGTGSAAQLIDSLSAADFSLPREYVEKLKACDK